MIDTGLPVKFHTGLNQLQVNINLQISKHLAIFFINRLAQL